MTQKKRPPKERKIYGLDPKKHGIGGALLTKPTRRKQDRRAKPLDGYAVVFFPKINGIGPASIWHSSSVETISQTPATAIAKHMDGILKGETWATYQRAGWRVRKIRITDLGEP